LCQLLSIVGKFALTLLPPPKDDVIVVGDKANVIAYELLALSLRFEDAPIRLVELKVLIDEKLIHIDSVNPEVSANVNELPDDKLNAIYNPLVLSTDLPPSLKGVLETYEAVETELKLPVESVGEDAPSLKAADKIIFTPNL